MSAKDIMLDRDISEKDPLELQDAMEEWAGIALSVFLELEQKAVPGDSVQSSSTEKPADKHEKLTF